MSEQPAISIVLPTYNGSRYLAQSIESCLAQTFTAWELIIVDDCSKDDTPRIIADYAARDQRIRPLRNELNRKLPASLNRGFAEARGKYFTWTSDDNLYRPEALAVMAGFLDVNPDTALVYCDSTYIDDVGTPLRIQPAEAVEVLPMQNCIGACFMYRHSVHDALHGYDETLFLVEDWDFWLRASITCKLTPLNRDLYLYRWHAQSLTSTRANQINHASEQTLVKNLPAMTWMSQRLAAQAYGNLIALAVRRGDGRAARKYFRLMTRDSRFQLSAFRRGVGRCRQRCRAAMLRLPVLWRLCQHLDQPKRAETGSPKGTTQG